MRFANSGSYPNDPVHRERRLLQITSGRGFKRFIVILTCLLVLFQFLLQMAARVFQDGINSIGAMESESIESSS